MQFNYTVRTKQSEIQSGLIEANDRHTAIVALQSRGLIILYLESISAIPFFARTLKISFRPRAKEIVAFSRQLATLFSAGVPLLPALRALGRQTDNEHLRNIIYEIANDVEGGMVFSKALARHSKIFSSFFVNMVKSGEASGSLEKSLIYLADYLEKQYYLMARIRGAMVYPAFILGSFLLIGALLMILVMPTLLGFLKESGQDLPVPTKIAMAVSGFLQSWWWLLLLAIFGGVSYFFYRLKVSPAFRRRWDAWQLKLPIFGKRVLQKLYLTRFADNLSTLIQGGLSILQALQVSSEIVGNTVFADIILEAKEDVRVGNLLSESLNKHEEIPPLVTQMIATGEQTGSLDLILKKLAQFYNKEIEATVDTISQLIEPILIVLIGVGVAILVASVLMPIYNLAGTI